MIFDADAMAELIARKAAELLGTQLDTVLTVDQAAELLQLHPNTVRKYAVDGTLPGFKFGDSWRFRRSALLERITTTNTAQTGVRQSLQLAGD